MTGELAPTSTPEGHILTLNFLAWGHTAASLNLVSKLVRFKPIYVTVGVVEMNFDKAVSMLDSLFTKGDPSEDELRALIRVTGISWKNFMNEADAVKQYREIFRNSCEQAPIPVHAGSTDLLPAVPKPKLVIADPLMLQSMRAVREISAFAGSAVKIYSLQSCSVAYLLLSGPKEEGKPGRGDFSKVVAAIMAETSDFGQANEKVSKAHRRQDGNVFNIAGLPPVYDYELLPQKSIIPFSHAFWNQWHHTFHMECDGVIQGTTPIIQKDAIAEFSRIFNFTPETTVCAGPFSFPIKPAPWDVGISSAEDTRALLDRALKEKGPNSAIYMSFGSAFWCVESEKIWAIVNTLLDKGIYLLFSHASPFAVIPEEMKAKMAASETTFASGWLPQMQILQHEACGWFITHCGENSYGEALSAGVPVICFPFESDQPLNAIYATDVHRVGYELYEARNGPGLGPSYRKDSWAPKGTVEALKEEFEDTLEKAFGEDGKEKRKNAQTYQQLLKESWKEGGESWKEIEKLFKIAV